MSLSQLTSSFFCTFNNLGLRPGLISSNHLPCRVRLCTNIVATKCSDETVIRRSASYQPSNWDYHFIESLKSDYVGEAYATRVKEMKREVKMMLEGSRNGLDQLEMIDALQRLGIAYHFEDEIARILKIILNNRNCKNMMRMKNDISYNLYATALEFRLLRQQGYNGHLEIFNSFKDEQGNFKEWLCRDLKGLIYLYEASYLSVEGEDILEVARDFAKKNIELYVKKQKKCSNNNNNNNRDQDQYLFMIASHALELPLHWRMKRGEARWFINVYENNPHYNPIFLNLAKLDFNMVQATHQEDLKHATSWWKKTYLGEKLNFVRARPMEGFLWTIGGVFEPQYGYFRRMLSRVGALVTVIDDIYDVYGTLEELQLFTDAVVRWDINAMDQLPHYMKICFLALYNSINEMGFDLLKDQGLHILPYLKKGWADLCKSYLLEAKWYHSGYIPTLEEYLENAWVSISAPLLLVHAYFTVTDEITKEASECLKEYPDIVRFSSLITRLTNDLGTSSHEVKRGDNPKAIECYMHETGASEEEAREHIRHLIGVAWKKINGYQIRNTIFSQTLMRMAMNLPRMAQCIYQHGDGFGAQNLDTKNHVISLLIHPVPLSVL